MSNRIATNIGHNPNRQLGIRPDASFAGLNALGTDDPNTLNGNVPMSRDAMGIVGQTCTVSFLQASGAQMTVTGWMWNEIRKKWVKGGPLASVYTLTVDEDAVATMTFPDGALVYFQGSAVSPIFLIGGARANTGAYPVKDSAGNMV